MTAEIGRKARSSVKIAFAGTVLQGLTQAAIMIVLARLLGPRDYGYYAIALSLSAMTTGLVSMSIERALVVAPDVDDLRGRSLPIVMLLAAVSVATVSVASLLVWLWGWSVVPGVLAVVCAAQAVAGLSVAPRVLLRRALSFGSIVMGELAGIVAGGGLVAIALARAGYGPYALAAGFVVQNLVSLAVLRIQGRRGWARPRFAGLASILRSAIQLSQVGGLEVLHVQLPALVLSARFGAVPLGLFNRVANLVTLPLQMLTTSMSRVMVSAVVAVSDDRERLARGTAMLMRVSTAIVTPLAFGIAGSAYAFTDTVLGARWLAAAPLVSILALATWAALTAHILAVIAEGMRAFAAKIRIQVATSLCLLAGLLTGSAFGLAGAAWGMVAASGLFLLLNIRLATRIIGVEPQDIMRWMAPGIGAGLTCLSSAWAVGRALRGEASPVILAAQVGACCGAALVFYLLFSRPLLAQAVGAILPVAAQRRIEALLGRA